MKDKHLYQKRKDGKYLGYTEDGFYYNSDEGLWCWEQTSKEVIHKAKTIEELREIKKQNLIGYGNYEHAKDTALPEGLVSTEEFARLTKIEKMSKSKKKIVVCTTRKKADDLLEKIVIQYGASVFRGSQNDIIKRFYDANKIFKFEI